ncbi:hypothetical protein [Sodalis sp. (in: enterobacteria)]|uniref:hypothetical protein n=1 Tax=Sodalis sp. (in: enterobacteria) TaxID=1898979 RepID=UPI003F2AF08C
MLEAQGSIFNPQAPTLNADADTQRGHPALTPITQRLAPIVSCLSFAIDLLSPALVAKMRRWREFWP